MSLIAWQYLHAARRLVRAHAAKRGYSDLEAYPRYTPNHAQIARMTPPYLIEMIESKTRAHFPETSALYK
jgi:hypothetical protein